MSDPHFDVHISARDRWSGFRLRELWQYRDMIGHMVRRDFVADYKQTILGPAWAVIQPLLTTAVTAFVFGNLAGMSAEGVPVFLFYLASQIIWGFFSRCLRATANTFLDNRWLMSRVYFPRAAMAISGIGSAFITLGIQAVLYLIFALCYAARGYGVTPDFTLILLPLYVLHLAVLALGVGMLLSALTIKYRDLYILITYGITFWMCLSPVVYDINIVPERMRIAYLMNPVSPVILHLRHALFGQGPLYWGPYAISAGVTVVLLLLGSAAFGRAERNFLDTI